MKLAELIQDDNGNLSSARLSMLFGVVVLAVVLLIMVWRNSGDLVGMATVFAGLCGGGWAVGKISESSVARAQIENQPKE